MNSNSDTNRRRFPILAVVITVIVTLLIAGVSAHFLGFLATSGHDEQAMVKAADQGGDEETLWTCGMHPQIVTEEPGNCPICGMKLVPLRQEKQKSQTATGGDREIAYWRAPMNPNEIYDQPGKSAMGMDLVPVYKDELVGGVDISIDPVMEQNMGVRVAAAEKGELVHTIRTYGHVTYDETLMARINLKFAGWIKKLYVDFTGEQVRKGEPMFDIYSPDLITAQQDLIEAARNYRSRASELNKKVLESVRSRLRYLDISDTEIKAIEESGTVQQTLTIRSPYDGVVIEKNAIEGDYVESGTTIYKLADLSRVWVEAHIYEYELPGVKQGQQVEMTLPYLPGKKFTGNVAFIYPYLQRQTRDVVVRLEFANPDLELKPDMYADVRIQTSPGDGTGIYVPESAVLRSGERNIVFVRRGPGEFTPREVTLGVPLDSDRIQILTGVAPGEDVVISGQFLLDSESKLQEAVRKMMEEKEGPKKAKIPEQAGGKEDRGFFEELEKQEPDNGFFEDLE